VNECDHRSGVCPSRETLAAFHAGRLSAPTSEEIAAHLARCPACASHLDQLADEPVPLLAVLGRPPEPEPYGERELERAVALAERAGLGLDPRAVPREPSAGEPPARDRLGQYQLLEPLGAGGMGQVFKARHGLMDRLVAVKLLHGRRLDHPEA